MKNIGGYITISISAIFMIAWLIWGSLIFFGSLTFDYKWTRGELGDFLGGGLGGIAVLIIIYTVWLQIGQIKAQQNEAFEAGVFRIFEALKPEVEGLSVRIISKAIKEGLVALSDNDESFDVMLQKYHNKDRTVFLRAMQNNKYRIAIQSNNRDPDLELAIDRFKTIMKLLSASLNQTSKNTDDDFSQAIRATEIYQTYEKCFPKTPN